MRDVFRAATPLSLETSEVFMLHALMTRQSVSKELWQQLQPLISPFTSSVKGGARKLGVSNEAALNGILFVLHTGIPWEDLSHRP